MLKALWHYLPIAGGGEVGRRLRSAVGHDTTALILVQDVKTYPDPLLPVVFLRPCLARLPIEHERESLSCGRKDTLNYYLTTTQIEPRLPTALAVDVLPFDWVPF